MPTDQVVVDCSECGRETVHLDRKPDTTLNLVLTVATFGLWSLVWGLLHLRRMYPACRICGTRNRRWPRR